MREREPSPVIQACLNMQEKKPSWVNRRLVVLGIVLAMLFFWFGRRSTDAQWVRQFNRNRSAFTELRMMLATNSSKEKPEIADTNIWSMEQYRRYQLLLRQTHVMRVFRDGEALHFQIAGSKTMDMGHRITVTWTEATPDCVISNLDDFGKITGRSGHAYRPLGDNWYLYITH